MIKSYGNRTHVKPTKKLKDILCKPKGQLEPKEVCDPVYKIVCGVSEGDDCPADYVGETERTLKARFAEHRRPRSSSSEVSKHINKDNPSHDIKLEGAQILVGSRPHLVYQGNQGGHLHQGPQTHLKQGRGRYNLPAIWPVKSHQQ